MLRLDGRDADETSGSKSSVRQDQNLFIYFWMVYLLTWTGGPSIQFF